jgi:integrase/recombinase XerD
MERPMTSAVIREIALGLAKDELQGKRYTEKTQKAAQSAQTAFLNWIEERGYTLTEMSTMQLREYHGYLCRLRSKRSGELLAAKTIGDRFYQAKLLFSLLYRGEVIVTNPASALNLKASGRSSMQRRPLTSEEITRFLEQIDCSSGQGLKDRTLFELIYSSGLRVSEAAKLQVKDIDFERREIVVRGKFDRDRVVPISKVAKAFLFYYLGDRKRQREAWVFCGSRGSKSQYGAHLQPGSISERFKTLLRRFEMDKKEICTHSIRHSTATHLLENGAGIRHVQELLGHKSIETTVRYTHIQIDSLIKIYRKHHPREHDLYEAVDESYRKRFDALFPAESPESRD